MLDFGILSKWDKIIEASSEQNKNNISGSQEFCMTKWMEINRNMFHFLSVKTYVINAFY